MKGVRGNEGRLEENLQRACGRETDGGTVEGVEEFEPDMENCECCCEEVMEG